MTGLRTALIVAVPEAGFAVNHWLERTADAKPSAGVPPHVTVLYPFAPAAALEDGILEELGALFAEHPAFAFELARCRHFPGVLYLAPEPSDPFRRLTEAVVAAYPEYPPYEGIFEEVVPHLTVAEGAHDVLMRAEADVRQLIPIPARATDVTLLEETEPDLGRWEFRALLPLGPFADD